MMLDLTPLDKTRFFQPSVHPVHDWCGEWRDGAIVPYGSDVKKASTTGRGAGIAADFPF